MLLSHHEIQERGTGKKESIHDMVGYYFMPASIEKKSFKQIEVCGLRLAHK